MSGGFDSLGLMPELVQGVTDLGWVLPTDIQDEAIPLIMGGGDVMAAAETGSGKTAAFSLPIIQCVYERLSGAGRVAKRSRANASAPNCNIVLSEHDHEVGLKRSSSGLECSSNIEGWAGARASHGVSAGKYYYECKVLPFSGDSTDSSGKNGNGGGASGGGGGLCRVGWSTMSGHLELGRDAFGFGYGGTAMASSAGSFLKYGEPYGLGDVVGCFLDLDRKEVFFSKNGRVFERAFDLTTVSGAVLFPAVLLKKAAMEVNFGAKPFAHPPRGGFMPINLASDAHLFDADAKEAFEVRGERKPLAIIVEPTKDLAEQVYESITDFSMHIRHPDIRAVLLVGDDKNARENETLVREGVDIVVGTMGKLTHMAASKALDLSQIRFFVLDEADRLLSNESFAGIMSLFSLCPGGGTGTNRLQVCFFSATLHSPMIRRLADMLCHNPTWVDLKGFESVPESVHHVMVRISPEEVAPLLAVAPLAQQGSQDPASGSAPTRAFQPDVVARMVVTDNVHLPSPAGKGGGSSHEGEEKRLLASQRTKELKPQVLLRILDKFQMEKCIIFCRTNLDCANLERFFNGLNGHMLSAGAGAGRGTGPSSTAGKSSALPPYSCAVLGGTRSLEQRRAALQDFKMGRTRLLICTDVAARGIDVVGLPYVVNMTLPDDSEDYIHRVGRVGRAGRMGLAISLVAAEGIEEKVWYHQCGGANRGANCTRRHLVTEGGCCLWSNESQQLEAVESRLHESLKPMILPELSLPPDIAIQKVQYGVDCMTEDGLAARDGSASAAAAYYNPNSAFMSSAVRDLAEMEVQAQNIYLHSAYGLGYGYADKAPSSEVLTTATPALVPAPPSAIAGTQQGTVLPPAAATDTAMAPSRAQTQDSEIGEIPKLATAKRRHKPAAAGANANVGTDASGNINGGHNKAQNVRKRVAVANAGPPAKAASNVAPKGRRVTTMPTNCNSVSAPASEPVLSSTQGPMRLVEELPTGTEPSVAVEEGNEVGHAGGSGSGERKKRYHRYYRHKK